MEGMVRVVEPSRRATPMSVASVCASLRLSMNGPNKRPNPESIPTPPMRMTMRRRQSPALRTRPPRSGRSP
jgi:hypothetical protein